MKIRVVKTSARVQEMDNELCEGIMAYDQEDTVIVDTDHFFDLLDFGTISKADSPTYVMKVAFNKMLEGKIGVAK